MNGHNILVYIVHIYYFERFVLFKQSKDWGFLIERVFLLQNVAFISILFAILLIVNFTRNSRVKVVSTPFLVL